MVDGSQSSPSRPNPWQRVRSLLSARRASRHQERLDPSVEDFLRYIEELGKAKTKKRSGRVKKIVFMFLAVLVLLAVGYWAVSQSIALGNPAKNLPQSEHPSIGDLATLLFGASSVAVILFSLLLAAGALFGYDTLKNQVKREIADETRDRVSGLERELHGRVLVAIGFMIGTLHSTPDQLEQSKEHKAYLAEAVYFLRQGYRILKNLPGMGKYMALNNLVYYSCLAGEGDEDPHRDFLLERSRVLRRIGQEYDHSDSLLTFCRVVLQHGSKPQDIDDAKRIAASLSHVEELTPRQKKEASFYVRALSARQ